MKNMCVHKHWYSLQPVFKIKASHDLRMSRGYVTHVNIRHVCPPWSRAGVDVLIRNEISNREKNDSSNSDES